MYKISFQLKFTSYGELNSSIIFDASSSEPPTSSFDDSKIRGYKLNVSYLTGDETVKKKWTTSKSYFSVAGLKLELESRYMYIFHLLRSISIPYYNSLENTYLCIMFHQQCSLQHPGYLTCCLLPPTLPEHHYL